MTFRDWLKDNPGLYLAGSAFSVHRDEAWLAQDYLQALERRAAQLGTLDPDDPPLDAEIHLSGRAIYLRVTPGEPLWNSGWLIADLRLGTVPERVFR